MKAGTEFLTVEEAATRMRVSKMTVYRLIQHGSIPAVKIGRSFRLPADEFEQYIKMCQT